MIRLVMFILLLASPVFAQTVTVRTGEHGAFTRVVLTYPTAVDWTLGRTDTGYGLAVNPTGSTYDLSSVYDLIDRDRLGSIRVDPASGVLQMGVQCLCHAIPFALNDRTIVIDLKDGEPPANSSFETALAYGRELSPTKIPAPDQPKQRVSENRDYDWLAQMTAAPTTNPSDSDQDIPSLETNLHLDGFRNSLLEEVSRGATQGVVSMEPPPAPPIELDSAKTDQTPLEPMGTEQASVSEIQIAVKEEEGQSLTVTGQVCPEPETVALGQWSAGEDAVSELTLAQASILTEFDVPDAAKVTTAIKTLLFFGFGAEARNMIQTFAPTTGADDLLVAISFLVDGDAVKENAFLSMQSCDSPAAIWALLAAPANQTPDQVNGAAIGQAFQTWPTHLRFSLGPEVFIRLLQAGDPANAEIVKRAFARVAPPDSTEMHLINAEQELALGNPAKAEQLLPDTTTQDVALNAIFAKIEARFLQRKQIDGADIAALEAFAHEQGSGPRKAEFDRALAHAFALGGDFRSAFSHADSDHNLTDDVWAILAEVGADSALLEFAVGTNELLIASLPPTVRAGIAKRLLGTGLANAADDWAKGTDLGQEFAARVALSNNNARAALQHLAAGPPDDTPALLAQTYASLGDFEQAADLFRRAGDDQKANQMLRWMGAWQQEDATKDVPWSNVTAMLATADTRPLPPLQDGQARLTSSAATREAVSALLSSVPTLSAP